MKLKCLPLIVLPLLLVACSSHRVADTGKLKVIRVVRYRSDDDSIVTNYTDRAAQRHIISALNHNQPDQTVFDPDCRIHIIYPDSTVDIVIHDNYMRYKGKVYRLNESMLEILN